MFQVTSSPSSSSSSSSASSVVHLQRYQQAKAARKTWNTQQVERNYKQQQQQERPAADGKKHHGSNKKHGSEKRAEEVFSVECFLVSRGWQLDQSRLLRALDGVQCANFARVQVTKMIIIGFFFACLKEVIGEKQLH